MKLVVIFEDEVKIDKIDLPFIIGELQKISDSDIVKEVLLYEN